MNDIISARQKIIFNVIYAVTSVTVASLTLAISSGLIFLPIKPRVPSKPFYENSKKNVKRGIEGLKFLVNRWGLDSRNKFMDKILRLQHEAMIFDCTAQFNDVLLNQSYCVWWFLVDATFNAAESGDIDFLRKVLHLESKVSAKIIRDKLFSATHAAAENGRTECLELLLQHGFDAFEEGGKDRVTSLFLATINGHRNCIRMLIRKGHVNINTFLFKKVSTIFSDYLRHDGILTQADEEARDTVRAFQVLALNPFFLGLSGDLYNIEWLRNKLEDLSNCTDPAFERNRYADAKRMLILIGTIALRLVDPKLFQCLQPDFQSELLDISEAYETKCRRKDFTTFWRCCGRAYFEKCNSKDHDCILLPITPDKPIPKFVAMLSNRDIRNLIVLFL